MIAPPVEDTTSFLWHVIGALGAALFYSRFWVQWLVSERRRESTIPLAFWYLSSAGTLALLAYAVVTRSPLGALGQSFNIVVYTRNIILIGRKSGTLSNGLARIVQAGAAVIALVAVALVLGIWYQEFHLNQASAPDVARQNWFWLAVGLVGQLLFAGRFLVQWIATERCGESTVPPIFWHLSIVASVLQAASFLQRQEWLFMTGTLLTVVIYARNIALLNANPTKERVAS